MSKALNLGNYYTAAEAAERISKNSGRTVQPFYMRQLARYGTITTEKFGRTNLYLKSDVDNYKVEARGVKLNRAKQGRSKATSKRKVTSQA